MRRLIVFGDGLTYPAKEGVSQHVMSLLLSLSKFPSVIDPVLIMCDRGTLSHQHIKLLPFKIILVPHATYYSYARMRRIITELNPDIIQTYSNYYARLILTRYSCEYAIPLFMEHHDIDYEFAKNYGIQSFNRSFQKEVAEIASCNRTLSYVDENILIKALPHRANTFFSLTSIIQDDFKDLKMDKKNATHMLFLGNGAYPPNKEAIEYISNVLAPKLPHLTFHIVGRETQSLGHSKNVIGHGMLDDLTPIVSKTAYGLAPLSHGSGLKTKNLSYLSAGMPVIGTPLAFHGYRKNKSFYSIRKLFLPFLLRVIVKTYTIQQAYEARKYFSHYYSEDATMYLLLEKYSNINFAPYITRDNSQPITHNDTMLPWLKESRENNGQIVKSLTYFNFEP